MPDTTITIATQIWEGVKWLLIFLAGLVGFNLRRLSAKVDEHDKDHISRAEFNNTINTMRKESREDFRSVHDKLDKIASKDK